MIYYEITDAAGKILAGNMQGFVERPRYENSKNFVEHQNGLGFKGVFEQVENINIWVVVQNDKDLLKSQKLFRIAMDLYREIALGIYRQYKNEMNAYAHVLNTIQAQMKQKIDDFADGNDFSGETFNESVANISKFIEKDTTSAADLIFYVQKRVIDMRANLLGAEVIHSGEQYEIKISTVSLKRAILNQMHPFVDELTSKRVQIKFFFNDDCMIQIDKNMFSLIMYNFFSNALKYTMSESEIRLNYSGEDRSLDVSMISLKMDRSELSDIHKEGVRGIHASNIPGKGIGLFVIRRALELMGKDPMYITPKYDKTFTEYSGIYVENHFHFSL